MYIIPGSATAGAFTETAKKITGTAVLYVPFIFSGGSGIMGTDSISGVSELHCPLSLNFTNIIETQFAETVSESTVISNSLSALNGETAFCRIRSVLGLNSPELLCGEISERLAGRVTISGAIGQNGITGYFSLIQPLPLTGISSVCELALPMTTGYLHDDTLTVYADGQDVTAFLSAAVIDLSDVPSVTAEFAGSIAAASLRFVINGESFSFRTKNVTSASDSTKITAAMRTDGTVKAIDVKAEKASEIALMFSDIVWAAQDHVLSNISGSYTSYELAELMADSAGLRLRLLPTGYLCVSGRGGDIDVTPAHIFDWQYEKTSEKYSAVTVTYGTGSLYVEADSSASAGQTVTVKVFGLYKGQITTDADSITQSRKAVSGAFTEEVYFSDGEAELKRPPESVLTSGVTFSGNSVYMSGISGYVTVEYTAVYDEYLLTNSTAGKRSVTIFSDNSVTLITNGEKEALTVKAPHLTDKASALILAAEMAGPENILTLTTSRNPELTLPSGIRIKTAKGSGRLRSAKISIKTSPLIIQDILEVIS